VSLTFLKTRVETLTNLPKGTDIGKATVDRMDRLI
jgi:hypothetical protein